MGRARELAEVATAYVGGGLNFRNRIINGDMRIDQRNNGASVTVTAGSVFGVDRFFLGGFTGGGSYTAQRSNVAPAGFTNSLLCTVTTNRPSLASSEEYNIRQNIEGFNVADLGWGTANAQTATLSFWVRSSLTGTFAGSATNNNYDRSYVFAYTINSANTWELKTVTIPGDTSGTWLTDNNAGIRLQFNLGAGSAKTAAAGVWSAGYLQSATGSVNLIQTTGATWQITGVQLEAGSVATPFERRPYGTELALCQRYYWKNAPLTAATNSGLGDGFQTGTTASSITVFYPVTMRALPSATQTNLIVSDNATYDADVSSIGAMVSTPSSGYLGLNHASAGATHRPCNLRSKASGGIGFIDFSAEL